MKTIRSVVLVLVAAVLFFASAKDITAGQQNYSYSRDTTFASGGTLRMKHSPALGINIPLAVRIDGRNEGAFTKGHVFERYLAPGPHYVTVARPRQRFDTWRGTIDVRPGQTYSFVVKATTNEIVLLPSRIDD
ncbi:MAG TPA: hypothetical protein VNP98_01175 [Chthoniobacterales bacterium]|nr:hypothetical protein [Chthoniobacterales bacterium]